MSFFFFFSFLFFIEGDEGRENEKIKNKINSKNIVGKKWFEKIN